MNVFGAYAKFYDALYKEKDYSGEVDYVERLFAQYSARPTKNVLDLGCGSGGHAIPLAQRGYQVTGVDRSQEMLNEAGKKINSGNPKFVEADLTEINLGVKFDAVISMFAVFSYITENLDLAKAFQTVRNHLLPGGLFFFDAWFGPAVLAERPGDRYKVINRGRDRVLRFAHPTLDILTHTVTVNYKVICLSADRILEELEEGHSMRFFFPLEIEYYLVSNGFELLSIHPFMEETRLMNERDWNMAIVARVPISAPSNEVAHTK